MMGIPSNNQTNGDRRMTNRQVINAWINGRIGSSGTLIATGTDLYSYELKIGHTDPNGTKIVLEFDSDGRSNRVSRTTSKHINLALRASN